MKYFALAALVSAATATEIAVGAECKKANAETARGVCAGSAASPPTACCASGKATADAAADTVQERCATIADAQKVTAVTTPAVAAVTGKAANECSPSGEAGGNNVDGTCTVCSQADIDAGTCTAPAAVTAVTAVDAVTAEWDAHCIESAAYLSASLAAAAYLMA